MDCHPKENTADKIAETEKLKKERGCNDTPTIYTIQDVETGEYYDRCPVSAVKLSTFQIIELHGFYRKGFMPYDGGVMKQPAYLMKRFAYLDAVYEMYKKNMEKK